MAKVIDLAAVRKHDARIPGCLTPRPHEAKQPGRPLCQALPSLDTFPISEIEVQTNALGRAHTRQLGRFLKGPIPLVPLATAARLAGKALAIFLAVHHQTTLTGKSPVTLPAGLLADFGVNKDSKARGLRELEQAGLVSLQHRRGCAARVRLEWATKPS
jgi:hypothetical protein